MKEGRRERETDVSVIELIKGERKTGGKCKEKEVRKDGARERGGRRNEGESLLLLIHSFFSIYISISDFLSSM